MDKSLPELLSFLQTSFPTMVSQLHQCCEINSGSDNLSGLALMHDALSNAFSSIADDMISRPLQPKPTIDMNGETVTQRFGNALFIRKRPHLKRRILLSGHMDTVFSATHSFQNLRLINDNVLNGPGVADMKGGLIVILHALTAFEHHPAASQLGWDVLINSEEELGSPASCELFKDIAPCYEAALVYEPAITTLGTLAKNRRGSGKLTLVATGKAAHVGRAFHEGHNAICYLATVVSAIHALNNQRDGVTLNVGKFMGGDALNIVPDKAVAKIDIRITHPDDEPWVLENIDNIIHKTKQEGCTLAIHSHFGRPIKRVNEATKQLFARVQQQGQKLGLNLHWEDSGGCCDGNNLAHLGLPVIDTLGVRGGEIHSSREFILLDSLVERAALSALLLLDLSQQGLKAL